MRLHQMRAINHFSIHPEHSGIRVIGKQRDYALGTLQFRRTYARLP